MLVGNTKFMTESGVQMSAAALEAVREEEEKAQTVAVVAVAGGSGPVGLVCVSDPVRAEAAAGGVLVTSTRTSVSLRLLQRASVSAGDS